MPHIDLRRICREDICRNWTGTRRGQSLREQFGVDSAFGQRVTNKGDARPRLSGQSFGPLGKRLKLRDVFRNPKQHRSRENLRTDKEREHDECDSPQHRSTRRCDLFQRTLTRQGGFRRSGR